MKTMRWAALSALLAAAPVAQAWQASRAPDPADPSAAVPAIVFRSALSADVPAAQDPPSPDKAWRAANDALAGQPAHAGHHAPAPAAAQAAANRSPQPAADRQAPRRADPAAISHDQHMHH